MAMDMVANLIRRNYYLLIFVLLIFAICLLHIEKSRAHPGRTDSSGGHTCRTNCESWGLNYGEYHYHNGGGGSGGLSEAGQARVAGADFARTENRARIESSAKVEGEYQGREDGLTGVSTPYSGNDSEEHCSQEIRFTSTPSATYREAFQTVYTRTCIHVYNDAYRTAYQTANSSALKIYEENKAKELAAKAEQKKADDAKSRNAFLLIVGAIGSLFAGSAMWSSYSQSTKK